MNVTKQQSMQVLNKGEFLGFTIETSTMPLKKGDTTGLDVFFYRRRESGRPRITNVVAILNVKSSRKDFLVVEKKQKGRSGFKNPGRPLSMKVCHIDINNMQRGFQDATLKCLDVAGVLPIKKHQRKPA